ncbi:MAG: hypothetical protein ACK550_05970, partial [Synechococcaceae cyanobacterium]
SPQPAPPGRDLPAPYVSPWRCKRQDLRAVLASLRLKIQELWRLNASGQLARPGFWPRPLAAGFWPLLLMFILVLAIAVVGRGLAAIAQRPEPATPGPQAERISSPPGASSSSTSLGAEPEQPLWDLDPEALAEAPAHSPSPSGSTDLLETRPAEPAGLESMAPLGAASGEGIEGLLGAGMPALPSPAVGTDRPETAGLGADEATGLLELFRAAAPQAPPQAVEFTEGPLTVVVRNSSGFARASTTAQQDSTDRWLELARERGFSQLTLLDPAGRLVGKQARVGSGMILLQPFREPP